MLTSFESQAARPNARIMASSVLPRGAGRSLGGIADRPFQDAGSAALRTGGPRRDWSGVKTAEHNGQGNKTGNEERPFESALAARRCPWAEGFAGTNQGEKHRDPYAGPKKAGNQNFRELDDVESAAHSVVILQRAKLKYTNRQAAAPIQATAHKNARRNLRCSLGWKGFLGWNMRSRIALPNP